MGAAFVAIKDRQVPECWYGKQKGQHLRGRRGQPAPGSGQLCDQERADA